MTTTLTPSQIYATTRRRIAALVGSLPHDVLGRQVPATPAWTVADLARHLAGAATDVVAGNIAGAPGDAWTAGQVDARKATAVADVLAEWATSGPRLETLIDGAGRAVYPLVMDVVTHEHDIRGAAGMPGERDAPGVAWARERLAAGLDRSLRKEGLPPLRIRCGEEEYLLGGGDPEATVTVEPFELFRALMGRRSAAQLRGYEWDGDAERYLPVLTVFPPAEVDIIE